jgi:hypothetical protein
MRKGYLGLLVFVLCFIFVGFAAAQTNRNEEKQA